MAITEGLPNIRQTFFVPGRSIPVLVKMHKLANKICNYFVQYSNLHFPDLSYIL